MNWREVLYSSLEYSLAPPRLCTSIMVHVGLMDAVKVPEVSTPKGVPDSDATAEAIQAAIGDTIDSRAERALVWKFDLRILPVLAIMYLFNSLDKSNLGNAKTAGLEGNHCTAYLPFKH